MDIAKGMVDEELSFTHLVINGDSIEVNDLEGRKEGKLITLTTELALKYKIADGIQETFEELLIVLELEDAEIKITDEKTKDEMMKKSGGRMTVPQIFIDEKHIGGFDDLNALDKKGELDKLLK